MRRANAYAPRYPGIIHTSLEPHVTFSRVIHEMRSWPLHKPQPTLREAAKQKNVMLTAGIKNQECTNKGKVKISHAGLE